MSEPIKIAVEAKLCRLVMDALIKCQRGREGEQRGSVIYGAVGLERQGAKQCRAAREGEAERGNRELARRGEGEGNRKENGEDGEEKIGELVERGRDIGSVVMRNIKEAWRGRTRELSWLCLRLKKRACEVKRKYIMALQR